MTLDESELSSDNKNDLASTVSAPQQMMTLPPLSLPPPSTLAPVESFIMSSIQDQASPGYRAILDCLRKRQDPPMLYKVLLALRTSALTLLTSNNKTHAHILHLLFRLDSFEPSSMATDTMCYTDLSLATAHLHLLVAIVSANSVFVTPALSCIWTSLRFCNKNSGMTIQMEEMRYVFHSFKVATLRHVLSQTYIQTTIATRWIGHYS